MSKSYCLWLCLLIGYQLCELSLPFPALGHLALGHLPALGHLRQWNGTHFFLVLPYECVS